MRSSAAGRMRDVLVVAGRDELSGLYSLCRVCTAEIRLRVLAAEVSTCTCTRVSDFFGFSGSC